MSDFFQLHQRQDLCLCRHENKLFLGLVLGYHQNSYAVKPMASGKGSLPEGILYLKEAEILQKVGQLDFDALYENDPEFDFGSFVEVENF